MVQKIIKAFCFFLIVFCLSFVTFISDGLAKSKSKLTKKNSISKQRGKKNYNAKNSIPQSKDFTKYVFKKGDTLAKVAKANNISLNDLKKLNNKINPRKITVGTVIKVPVIVATNNKPSKSEGNDFIYRVKKGDTLYSIASKYNLSTEDIKSLNKINDDNIVAGMPLLIEGLNRNQVANSKKEIYSLTDAQEEDYDGDENVSEGNDYTPLDKNASEERIPPYTIKKDDLNKMISYSLDFLGTDYKYGGSSVAAIDCSAFVKTVFKEVNINLPRTSREQVSLGLDVTLNELKEGDLLFFAKKKRINHVGMYIGNDMFIHAARKGKGVIVTKLDSPYVKKHFVKAKRLFRLEENDETTENKKDLSLAEKPLIN